MRAEAGPRSWNSEPRSDAIEIAFVNNMPDQALASTQAQFERLVHTGARGANIRLRPYALATVPRSETAHHCLAQTHEEIAALHARGADALIVTGTEPRAPNLRDEPFWQEFARLVDWARDHTISSIWSCLAAHAAVLRLDGIERRRAAEKISGVYCFAVKSNDWPMHDASSSILVPHSRYNGLARDDLERCGYHVASWSDAVGVDLFWKRAPSVFVFLQGHPEYDADTLAREYRRDVARFLAGERDLRPRVPHGCFLVESIERLSQIEQREMLAAPWAADSARLYRNWLALVVAGKAAKRRMA